VPPTKDAGSIADIAAELGALYKLEAIADNLGEIASALHGVATATAMRVLVEHGSQDDREIALVHLKAQFEAFRGR